MAKKSKTTPSVTKIEYNYEVETLTKTSIKFREGIHPSKDNRQYLYFNYGWYKKHKDISAWEACLKMDVSEIAKVTLDEFKAIQKENVYKYSWPIIDDTRTLFLRGFVLNNRSLFSENHYLFDF